MFKRINFEKLFASTIFLLFAVSLSAQNHQTVTAREYIENREFLRGKVLMAQVEDGDTNLFIKIRPIKIFPPRKFKNKREKRKYNRLARKVKKVYPYAQKVKKIFNETELVLMTMDNKREKKKYLKKKEKELKKEFEDDIRNMTFSEGRILIKLIDRETGRTSYELIRHFKGNVSAMFWQSIARIFSTDLKYNYNAKGEDEWIEEIVAKIENGLM